MPWRRMMERMISEYADACRVVRDAPPRGLWVHPVMQGGRGSRVAWGVEVEGRVDEGRLGVEENRVLLLEVRYALGSRLCGCTILLEIVPSAHLHQTVLLLKPIASPSEATGAQTPRGVQVGSGIMVRTFSTSSRDAPFFVASISTNFGILVHFHALWYARQPVGKPLSLSTS